MMASLMGIFEGLAKNGKNVGDIVLINNVTIPNAVILETGDDFIYVRTEGAKTNCLTIPVRNIAYCTHAWRKEHTWFTYNGRQEEADPLDIFNTKSKTGVAALDNFSLK